MAGEHNKDYEKIVIIKEYIPMIYNPINLVLLLYYVNSNIEENILRASYLTAAAETMIIFIFRAFFRMELGGFRPVLGYMGPIDLALAFILASACS